MYLIIWHTSATCPVSYMNLWHASCTIFDTHHVQSLSCVCRWNRQPTTGEPPLGVMGYACDNINRDVYYFGGYCGHDDCRHNSLNILHLQDFTWSCLYTNPDTTEPMKKQWLCHAFLSKSATSNRRTGSLIAKGPITISYLWEEYIWQHLYQWTSHLWYGRRLVSITTEKVCTCTMITSFFTWMSLEYLYDICHVNCVSKKGEHVHVDMLCSQWLIFPCSLCRRIGALCSRQIWKLKLPLLILLLHTINALDLTI